MSENSTIVQPELMRDPAEMSVIEHLEELRWRIIKSVTAVTFAAIAVFCFNGAIIHLLERPLTTGSLLFHGHETHVELIFTSPSEYFMATIKVAVFGGLYLALPVILYQLLAFIAPGLTSKERRWAVPTVAAAFVLFTLGSLFSYYFLLPAGLQFLVGFAPADVHPMLTIGKYINFAAGLLFATGMAFQLPLFLLGASAMGLVTSYLLARYRRHALLAAFVLGTVITPSVDLVTQSLLGLALYALFELSIWLIRLTGK